MKKFFYLFLISMGLFSFQKIYASSYSPVIKDLTPADGTTYMVTEAEAGKNIDIYFYVENLTSCASPFGFYGHEIWITIDDNEIFHFKNGNGNPAVYTYGPLTLYSQWFSVGTHALKIRAKSYILNGIWPLNWVDTFESEKTNMITIKHPFTVNISRTLEFDQTEILPSQHSASGDPISISVSSTYSHSSGRQYAFAGWHDGNNSNPRTVIDNATIYALYKLVHKSNNAAAFSRNSQRKLIETGAGGTLWLHQVYASMGHVWIEHSSDNGSTWTLGNSGRPLDVGGGKCPSIAVIKNGSYNCIAVVWQQKYGTCYTIEGKIFNQGSGVPVPVSTTSLFTEPVDLYDNVDANPNVIIEDGLGGGYLVVFERKTTSGSYSKGLYYLVGELRDEGELTSGPFTGVQIQGVIADTYGTTITAKNAQLSLNPSCLNSAYRITADIVFEYSPLVKQIYLDFQKTSGTWHFTQLTTNTISTSSGTNYNPSIVAHQDDEYSACWINNIEGNEDGSWPDVDQMVYYYSMYPSVRYYMGYGVQSCAVNAGGYSSGFAAWSQIYNNTWTNKSVKFSYGSPTTNDIRTLSTTGKYIQLANSTASGLNNMYVSSFNQLSSPYYFATSSSLVPVTKQATESIVEGRGCIITKNDASFVFRIDGLNVDNANINFIDAPDTLNYSSISNVNNAMLSEPFILKSDSRILLTELSGFSDSLAASGALGENKYITAVIELVDGITGESLGVIRSITVNSSNCPSLKVPSYSVNTAGIISDNARLKVTFASDLEEPQIVLTKSFADVNLALEKSTVTELTLGGSEIPTTYALEQNYPNPFNPTTTINYQLPSDGIVTLKIYDALGREVKTLVNEVKLKGKYTVTFNASGFASGVYFYRINVNDYTATKKLMLLK